MTTTFELASTNAFQPWNTNLNQLTAATRVPVSTETNHPTLGQDTAALSASLLSIPVPTQDDSRAAHVAAITQSIAAGTYFVSALDVAGSILDSLF